MKKHLLIILAFIGLATVQSTAQCNAYFDTFNDPIECSTIYFVDLSTASLDVIYDWNYDFGDGNFSSGDPNPVHTYEEDGIYNVCLIATDTWGCESTYCEEVEIDCVVSTCEAAFQYTLGDCPTVSFFDASISSPGLIGSWSYDFGDGSTSIDQNPTHTYANNGTYLVCSTITTEDACTSSYCDTITIDCIEPIVCEAAFQYTLADCPTISFFDASTSSPGVIGSWSYDFGDGNISTVQNPTHTYANNGMYVVCSTITTEDACTSTYCDTLAIDCIEPIVCDAAFQYTLGDCPTVSFFDASTSSPGLIGSWSYDFGDGHISDAQNPVHTYSANGEYEVCLTTTSVDACTSTYCETIFIDCIEPPACEAAFQYTLGDCPTVSFFDASTSSPGLIGSWSYDFGDGNISTVQNPTHTYANNGMYVVCSTITTEDDCTSTYCDTLAIDCIEPIVCEAAFQYTLGACPTVSFFDASTSSPGLISSWSYDFGDGHISDAQNPLHTYSANGEYEVCLTTTSVDACTSTYCETILIDCIAPDECEAYFEYFDSDCYMILFFDDSYSAPGEILSWEYDMGDGTIRTDAHPIHVYEDEGFYIACLTITTSGGCTSTYCDTIEVNCAPDPVCEAAFEYESIECAEVAFYDASYSTPEEISTWSYDFGDGTSSSEQNPVHTYSANGEYEVCLTTTSVDACTSTYCETIFIDCIAPDECEAYFDYFDSDCYMILFFDESYSEPGEILSWEYDMGDGTIRTDAHPIHVYEDEGLYLACLTITTSGGCTSTYCNTIEVNCAPDPVCEAAFEHETLECSEIAFYDASYSTPEEIITWSYDFGDGAFSAVQNPVHAYSENGEYEVCLTTTSVDGCTSTYCETIFIECIVAPECMAEFEYENAHCASFIFYDTSFSTGEVVSWSLDYGDGTSTDLAGKKHTYEENGMYEVCLTITTNDGCTDTYCETIEIDCLISTGLEQNEMYQVQLSPNPASSYIMISDPRSFVHYYEIRSITGELVRSSMVYPAPEHVIDVSDLAKGVYWIDLQGSRIRQVIRFVKR